MKDSMIVETSLGKDNYDLIEKVDFWTIGTRWLIRFYMVRFRIIFLPYYLFFFWKLVEDFNLCAIVNLQVTIGVHQWQGWCLGCVLWSLGVYVVSWGVCGVWLGQAACVALGKVL